MAEKNLFSSLQRLFSTDVLIRNVGGTELKIADTNQIQTTGKYQTNSLLDRFSRLYIYNNKNIFNPNLNYQTLRIQLYSDYEAMDTDALIASTLDVLADESTLRNDQGEVLSIKSTDENIQRVLYNLYYDILNIEFNLWSWVRNMCIHEDSLIPLLDGTEISIKELAKRHKENPENDIWVYSVQEGTNKTVPGKVSWCDITRENTEVVRVTFDDDTYLDTTPDHKFILRDGSKQQAIDLIEGQSLMPFYTRNDKDYEEIYNPEANEFSICHELLTEVPRQFNNAFTGIRELELNHKVKSVEVLTTLANTYCMEVVGANGEQDRHNFAVCSNNLDGTYTRNGVFVSNCKYGDFFLKLEISEEFGVYNVLPYTVYHMARHEGNDRNEPAKVTFTIDPDGLASSADPNYIPKTSKTIVTLENYEVAHFRLISDTNYLPYGRAYIEPARKIYKQLTLMEDAMLIHRIMRAPEKRTFFVNVGSIPPNEVEQFMQKTINSIKKTPYVDPQTGQYNLKFNMQNMMEDFYLPVRGGDTSTRIETTKGLEYDGTNDIEYLRDKMFAALKVPKAYFGYEKDLCIVPETEIPLLDGTVKTVEELINDHEKGIQNYTYSIDENTQEIVPGKVLWAGYTRRAAELVRVWLDNDKYIDTTPDHLFMLRDGKWSEAQNLSTGEPLMPLYLESTTHKSKKGYTTVYNPATSEYKEVHRIVPEYYGEIKKGEGKVVHHLDFNKTNNNPDNLDCSMTFMEHRKYEASYKNHKVARVEFLTERRNTCDLHIENHHNFGTAAGVIIHNSGKATLAAEDIRFARTVERLQKIIESELTKIGLVHLYAQGFTGESLTNFEIKLTTPSIVYEQERVALMKEKMDLARQMQETRLFSSDYIYDNIFQLSEDTYNEMRGLIREDAKRDFRISQIENEGNDPVQTGNSYGTPHDLASLYAARDDNDGEMPLGYDEKNPEGRPKVHSSILGTQKDPLGGIDRLGTHGMKGGYKGDGDDSLKEDTEKSIKESYKATQGVFLRNKDLFSTKKKLIFEKVEEIESNMMNESNIQDLDN